MSARRALRVAGVAVLTAAALGAGATPGGAGTDRARPVANRVLVVSLPYVSWGDLDGLDLPNLDQLLDESAVADLSTRAPTLGIDLAGGYATLGAGNKAIGARTPDDGAAFEVREGIGSETARQVFARRTGIDVEHGLVHLGIAPIDAANRDSAYHADVGALGDALARAGFTRAVIGNADGIELWDPAGASRQFRREAVAALMGSDGTVPAGAVDRGLLQGDPNAPFGVRLDGDAVLRAFERAWGLRSVVLVEASDLVRVNAYRELTTATEQRVLLERALQDTDELLGHLLARVRPGDAVMVVGPVPPADDALTIAAVRAPGFAPGLLRSGTTQRSGFVQLMDVAPSVLKLVGVPRPDSMRGRAIAVVDHSGSAAARRHFLIDADDAARFRAEIIDQVAIVFVVLAALLAIGAALVLTCARFRGARALLVTSAYVLLGYLPAVYLARLLPFHEIGVAAYWAFLAGTAVLLGLVARAVGRRLVVDSLLFALAVVTGVLAVDAMLGSPLQFNSGLGFSPAVAGRFIGFGNAGYAALTASSVLLAGLLAYRIGGRGGAGCGVAVLAAVLVIDGAPFWGADVGGVLSLVPAFGVTAGRLLGIRLRVRTVMLGLVATIGAVLVATIVDLQRPAGERSHLARLVEQINGEGGSAFSEVVRRKLGMNLQSLTTSNWVWILPVALAFVAFLAWWPPRYLEGVMQRIPQLRAVLGGFVVLAVLGYALNDSGVVVPGVMLGILVAVLVALAVGFPVAVEPDHLGAGGIGQEAVSA